MHSKFLPPDIRCKVLNERGYVVLTPESEELILCRFLAEMEPLRQSKKLGAFLLQLSPSFGPRHHKLSELDSIRNLVAPNELAVELRNRDWVVGEQLAETLKYFNSTQTTLVSVDASKTEHFTVMPDVDVVTNPKLGYFRFHGRTPAWAWRSAFHRSRSCRSSTSQDTGSAVHWTHAAANPATVSARA